MSGTLLQVIGILAVIALVGTLVLRPTGAVPVILAFAVVVAAIVVSWRDVEHYHQQRNANAAFQQESASAHAVTVPAPDHPRAGS